MANRYSGLTREQQARRRKRLQQSGVRGDNSVYGNIANGRSFTPTRLNAFRFGISRLSNVALQGYAADAGVANYPRQEQNANSRKRYRQVRAALGLSAG